MSVPTSTLKSKSKSQAKSKSPSPLDGMNMSVLSSVYSQNVERRGGGGGGGSGDNDFQVPRLGDVHLLPKPPRARRVDNIPPKVSPWPWQEESQKQSQNSNDKIQAMSSMCDIINVYWKKMDKQFDGLVFVSDEHILNAEKQVFAEIALTEGETVVELLKKHESKRLKQVIDLRNKLVHVQLEDQKFKETLECNDLMVDVNKMKQNRSKWDKKKIARLGEVLSSIKQCDTALQKFYPMKNVSKHESK